MRQRRKTERVTLMMELAEAASIDEWRRAQPDLPSRSEAIRRLIEAGLRGARKGEADGRAEPRACHGGNPTSTGRDSQAS
jgi:hypothetical protein